MSTPSALPTALPTDAVPTTAQLVEAALAITDILDAEAALSDTQRSVSTTSIDAMTDAGLWRILTPRTFGGWEAGLRAQVETLFVTAAADSAAGWVQMVINAHAWIVANFEPACQDEVFAGGPDTRVPGTLAAQGRATPVDGGWEYNGRWQFASGVDHGEWVLVGAGTDAPERAVHALIPKTDLVVDDTWFTLGLRGTGSKDLVCHQVFVPSHRVMPTKVLFDGVSPHGERHATHFNRLPVNNCLSVQLAAAVVGMTDAGLDLFVERTSLQREVYLGSKRAERPGTQMRLAESIGELDAARQLVLVAADRCDEVARTGVQLTIEERALGKWRAAYAVELCRRSLDRVYAAAGAHSIYDDSALQKRVRDVATASHHAIADFDSTAEMFGRVSLGMSPGTPLV